MSCKEPLIRAAFDSATVQEVAADGVVELPNVTVSSKCDATVSGGTITLRTPGTYVVHVNATTAAAAAGTEELQLYVNGAPKIGAHALGTAAAAGDLTPLAFNDLVTVECCNTVSLTVRTTPATTIRVANVIVNAATD